MGNRVPVKSSGLAPGLPNAWPWAAQNLQMPLPGTDKAGKCFAVAWGGGGGGGGVWAQLELTDALFLTDDEALTWLLLEMCTVLLYRRTLYLKRPLKKVEE